MTTKKINEGIAALAGTADADHEVQMARAELYKIASNAIELYQMLKNVSEQEGLEAWQQSKITKAADYIESVHTSLAYSQKVATPIAPMERPMSPGMSESQISDYKAVLEKAMIERNSDNKLKKDVHTAKVGHAADVGGHNYSDKKLAPLQKRGANRDQLKTAVAKMKRAGRAEQKHGKEAGYVKTLNDFGKDPRKRK
jgi:hypothetical protein